MSSSVSGDTSHVGLDVVELATGQLCRLLLPKASLQLPALEVVFIFVSTCVIVRIQQGLRFRSTWSWCCMLFAGCVPSFAIQVFLEDQTFVDFDLTGSSLQRVIELACSEWEA